MNPFQKLRRAVDKATLNYQIESPPPQTAQSPHHTAENFQKTTVKMNGNETSLAMGPLLVEQQTKFIQQINQLSLKNERLQRSLKMMDAEKQQYIQQICVLEKNNEVLEDKVRELHTANGQVCEKERKYQEEIYRINKTVQMLGKQINEQRNLRKNVVGEFSRFREDAATANQRNEKLREELEAQIKRMQEQLKQRSDLLEYNILRNSEERKENRLTLEKTKQVHDEQIKELNQTVMYLKDEWATLKTNFQVLNHKHTVALQKSEELQGQNSQFAVELSKLRNQNQELQANLKESGVKIQQLDNVKRQLEVRLKEAKENVRVKVVEVKDQSLQMELEMYKRQCKELLQERAVIKTMGSNNPAYQIIK